MAEPKPSSITCATCGKQFDPAASPAVPFCSHRCRRIDMRRWLQEEISLPYVSDEEEAERPRDPDDE